MVEKEVTLPVTGMTCANCTLNVERNLKKLEGVKNTTVNLASEQAVVSFDSERIQLIDITNKIEDTGYGVTTTHVEIPVTGMTCANCAMNIERTLKKKVPGVVEVFVNFAPERAQVEYVPAVASVEDMILAIERAGYGAIRPEETVEGDDAEAAARKAEIKDQTRKLLVGVIFAAPLFFLSMGRDFGILGSWSHAAWVNWLFLALATPTAMMAGTGIGAEKGILFKNSEALETAGKLDTIIMDKTGTVTEGKPVVVDLAVLDGRIKDQEELLRIAASVESGSEHPLGHAIVGEAKRRGLELFEPYSFRASGGLGVQATINGNLVMVGKPDWYG